MVQPKKAQGDMGNGINKREPNTSFSKKDLGESRSSGANAPKADGRGQNGTRSGFRTDAAISNSRLGSERTLQPWVPDSSDGIDGSLEKASSGGTWDQFAENERLFGLTTDYDENIYTTTIDKSHPQYRERIAAAERKAREIERSLPTTAHVAEERIMDYTGGDDRGGDEEDRYSGVRRQEISPLSSRENKYIPPSKRAPSGLATVAGAPVDPAIISSQIRAPQSKKQSSSRLDDSEPAAQPPTKTPASSQNDTVKATETSQVVKAVSKPEVSKQVETNLADSKAPSPKPSDSKSSEKSATPLRPSAATSRTISPQVKEGAPSATSTVERDVLNSFKTFASQQRQNAEKVRSSKAKADKEVKLTELKKFADNFKLSTPVPTDLISIIAKDPGKQKEIQAKALQNAEEVARAKADAAIKDKDATGKEPQAKPVTENSVPPAVTEVRGAARSTAPVHTTPPSGGANRHQGGRQSYATPQFHQQAFRNDRAGSQHMQTQNRQPLAQRLRSVEQQKMSHPPPNHPHNNSQDIRLPPTGPANPVESSFTRRLSGVPGHITGKLNPNSHEFRPNPFATSFNPNSHPSAGSSPRSAVNNVTEGQVSSSPTGHLIRRKTKAIDVQKCFILAYVKCIPHQGRNLDDNDGLKPSYDTLPTWRQLQETSEKPDSSMLLTYKEFLERQSFPAQAMATPNPPHVIPQLAHQHQLPFHLQHGAHGMAPRQSPHMPPMQMHAPHGPLPHVPFSTVDDHRMMHSNSAQSFASPRMAPVPITYAPAVNSPAQVPYNQPVMQTFVGPGTPQMGQYRSFSNTPQYIPQQSGHLSGHMMVQPQFLASPQGLIPAPQMQMYAGAPHQFIPQSAGPPQAIPGTNGYPSPGRSAAPMMAHQGSQQGQPVYGMSPNMPYQQPAFTPQQPGGQVGNIRGYNSPGPQHFGTSPQQVHQYAAQHRSGSSSYGPKTFTGHGQHQAGQQGHQVPVTTQGRTSEGLDEAK